MHFGIISIHIRGSATKTVRCIIDTKIIKYYIGSRAETAVINVENSA